MNSFATRDASLDALAAPIRELAVAASTPTSSRARCRRSLAADLEPVSWPDDPALEWAPPGHGDLYPSLLSSGMLDALLEAGYEYAFVANVDNLGGVMDPRASSAGSRASASRFAWRSPTARPPTARAGISRAGRGGTGSSCASWRRPPRRTSPPTTTSTAIASSTRTRCGSSLPALAAVLRERDGALGLPLIVNRKTVDPADRASPAVLQLESAMGAAIEVFDDARRDRVPRERFAPVKTTTDLLALRSDAYALTDEWHLELAARRARARARRARPAVLRARARSRRALPRRRALARGVRPACR